MSNKATAQRLYDALNAGRFDQFDEIVAENFIEHEVVPGVTPGRDGVRQLFRDMRAAFDDWKMQVEDMAAEGDRVWVRVTMSGRQRAEFLGVPSSGKAMSVPLVDIFRIADGKVAEHWGVSDTGVMMRQLS